MARPHAARLPLTPGRTPSVRSPTLTSRLSRLPHPCPLRSPCALQPFFRCVLVLFQFPGLFHSTFFFILPVNSRKIRGAGQLSPGTSLGIWGGPSGPMGPGTVLRVLGPGWRPAPLPPPPAPSLPSSPALCTHRRHRAGLWGAGGCSLPSVHAHV